MREAQFQFHQQKAQPRSFQASGNTNKETHFLPLLTGGSKPGPSRWPWGAAHRVMFTGTCPPSGLDPQPGWLVTQKPPSPLSGAADAWTQPPPALLPAAGEVARGVGFLAGGGGRPRSAMALARSASWPGSVARRPQGFLARLALSSGICPGEPACLCLRDSVAVGDSSHIASWRMLLVADI